MGWQMAAQGRDARPGCTGRVMHVVIFRLASAIALLFVFALVLGACAKPPERNIWREMIDNGELP